MTVRSPLSKVSKLFFYTILLTFNSFDRNKYNEKSFNVFEIVKKIKPYLME